MKIINIDMTNSPIATPVTFENYFKVYDGMDDINKAGGAEVVEEALHNTMRQGILFIKDIEDMPDLKGFQRLRGYYTGQFESHEIGKAEWISWIKRQCSLT